jgi:hypothetical protein
MRQGCHDTAASCSADAAGDKTEVDLAKINSQLAGKMPMRSCGVGNGGGEARDEGTGTRSE